MHNKIFDRDRTKSSKQQI